MCGPSHASCRAQQNVFLSSAPQASTGASRRRTRDRRAARIPRERRSTTGRPAMTRAMESSQRVTISRSCRTNRSATPPSRVTRLGVAVGDRLFREVARGHHQRARRTAEQQVVQRRVGQQDPDQRVARRDRLGQQRRGVARVASTIGRSGEAEQPFLAGARSRDRLACSSVAHHHGERLLVAVLPIPQASHGRVRRRVAREVEAADPLDRDDASVARAPRGRDSMASPSRTARPSAPRSVELRPARRAGVRLRVEPAIVRRSSYSRWHAGHIVNGAIVVARPVVGARSHREARPAVRAVGEGIAVAAVPCVADFGEALGTRRQVRRDRDVSDRRRRGSPRS